MQSSTKLQEETGFADGRICERLFLRSEGSLDHGNGTRI